MIYPGLSQTQVPETSTTTEYAGFGNPITKYQPQAGRADRLQGNIVGSTIGNNLASGGYPASASKYL